MESIAELRQRVQAPVRKYNDVAGLLVGDRLSIHLTRAFVRLGLSPNWATLGMLVFGVAGSVLVACGGAWAVAGFASVFLYYLLDCVDGEVARYHRSEKLIFGLYDFLFHLWVKSAFFVALGVLAVRTTGEPWTFTIALAGLLGVLFQKFLTDLSVVLVARYILMRADHERRHFVAQVMDGASEAELSTGGALPDDHVPFAPSGPLAFLRAAATNFDLAVLVFLAAAIGDLFLAPFPLAGLTVDLKLLLVGFYGLVFPMDFVDHLVTHLRTGRFKREARRLLCGAHQFELPRDRGAPKP